MEDVQKKEPFSWILFVEDYWFVAGLLVDRQLLGPAPFIPCYLTATSSPTLRLAASGACRVVLVGAASPLLACLGWAGVVGGTGTEELFSHREEGDGDHSFSSIWKPASSQVRQLPESGQAFVGCVASKALLLPNWWSSLQNVEIVFWEKISVSSNTSKTMLLLPNVHSQPCPQTPLGSSCSWLGWSSPSRCLARSLEKFRQDCKDLASHNQEKRGDLPWC